MKKEIEIFDVKDIKSVNIFNNSSIAFFGIFCKNGFIYEKPELYGISHFSEHMMFKGTNKRTTKEINRDFAKLGSSSNAYTSSDEVCYFCTFLNQNFKKSCEILCDMFFNSKFDSNDIEKEKKVILEEKKMYEDDPSHNFMIKCGDLLNPIYGHDAIGTIDTISKISHDDLLNYLNKTLGKQNLMFVFCGNLETENIKEILNDLIPDNHSFFINKNKNITSSKLWNAEKINNEKKIKLIYEKDNIEQSQIIGLFDSLSANDVLKMEEVLILSSLGGGDYSLMFETLREDLSLCYSLGIHTDSIEYPHLSLSKIYGMVDKNNINKFIEETEKLFNKIAMNGIDEDLFNCTKNSVSTSLARSTETSKGKTSFLMKRIFFNKNKTIQEYIDDIQKINLQKCNDVATHIFSKINIKWAVMTDDVSKINM